jgi:anti-sigma factor RsiW
VTELDVRCAVVSELVTRYLEGALPREQRLSYETHLVYCTHCVAFLSDIRRLREDLRELPLDPVDGDERRLIVDAAPGER